MFIKAIVKRQRNAIVINDNFTPIKLFFKIQVNKVIIKYSTRLLYYFTL